MQEIGLHEIFSPKIAYFLQFEMDAQSPCGFTGPKSPSRSANDLVPFDPAKAAIETPTILRGADVVSSGIIDPDLADRPGSRCLTVIGHTKSELAEGTGIGIVRTHQLLLRHNSNDSFFQNKDQAVTLL